ncbi:hypothetical protein OEZ85_003902 [Tetradesmus obliquus]|uniref:Uncharacterized protein n=1 Tax=Tetradesmus obliquus TaxID=3088 RepID=A0ABY8UCP4_TETOB|nr:hypothetical protein OEZ85_003902 [Tetradesmus obliquus]
MGDANREFMEKPENKNLHTHLQYMLQLLSPHDDPLLIGSDIVTDRMLAMERLSGGRVTSVNNAFSAVRCAFRLLFGRSLQPGIEAELTTVKVGNDKLRIDLHSPLPDAAVSEYKTELSLRGTLAREAQGTIRSLESVQLQLVYALTALLEQLDGLKRWPAPDFIPPRSLDQVNRWSQLVLALLFWVLCNERPSDITLYHLGCFKLAAPDHSSTHLASLALAGLQQDAVHHIDDMLEAFRGAGAVLLISAPKCKQSERKRGRGGGQQQHVDWLSVRKHLLQPQLALWDPARLVVLCLMASWFSRGSIAARVLLSRRFRSAKAAPKRQQQPDFQAEATVGCWKVPTAGDLHGTVPTLYLVQQSSSRAVQSGVRLLLSAQLASHSPDEALKYASNCSYDLQHGTAAPIKLASPEWREGTPVPVELPAGSSIAGVPLDLELLSYGPSAVAAATDPKLAAVTFGRLDLAYDSAAAARE